MKKAHRFILVPDKADDFEVIGICSALSDYRAAWLLNQTFEWQLQHSNTPITIPGKKNASDLFDYFWYKPDEVEFQIYLIPNKQNGKQICVEFPQLDYLLIVQDHFELNSNEMIQALRALNDVMAAYVYNSVQISNAEYLLFEQ